MAAMRTIRSGGDDHHQQQPQRQLRFPSTKSSIPSWTTSANKQQQQQPAPNAVAKPSTPDRPSPNNLNHHHASSIDSIVSAPGSTHGAVFRRIDSGNGDISIVALPSPTLTNPDMILPYSGSDSWSVSHSPPFTPQRQSSLRGHNATGSGSSLRNVSSPYNTSNGNGNSSGGYMGHNIGLAISPGVEQQQQQQSSVSSYGRWPDPDQLHIPAPPLSDINEEDTPRSSRVMPDEEEEERDAVYGVGSGSPVYKPRTKNYGLSAETSPIEHGTSRRGSASTVGTASDGGTHNWEGFDAGALGNDHDGSDDSDDTADAKSDDGVDNVSVAGSEIENSVIEGDARGDDLMNVNMDELNSAALSKRAEMILANAKKRLTSMEGNLSRARTSFRMTPSPSGSPLFSSGYQKPIGGLYRSISQADRRPASTTPLSFMKHRQMITGSPGLGISNQGHTRGQSETSIPSTLKFSYSAQDVGRNYRSSSALGSSAPTTGLTKRHSLLSLVSPPASAPHRSASASQLRHTGSPYLSPLNPLQENEALAETSPTTGAPGISPTMLQSGARIPSTIEEFNDQYPQTGAIPRSRSIAQMRDIHSHLQNLQDKISTLKVQAQEDNMRRRSLQNLRNPNPFTSADEWSPVSATQTDDTESDAGYGWSHVKPKKDGSPKLDEDGPEELPNGRPAYPIHHESSEPSNIVSAFTEEDGDSVAESRYEDAEQDFDDDGEEIDREALAAILNEPEPETDDEDEEYEEAVMTMERHEDREDALDYETYFLRQALQRNYGGNTRGYEGSDSGSVTSEGSIETARAVSPKLDSKDADEGEDGEVIADNDEEDEDKRNTIVIPTPRGHLSGHFRQNSVESMSTLATFATATEGRGSDEEDEEATSNIDQALGFGFNGINPNGIGHALSTPSELVQPKTITPPAEANHRALPSTLWNSNKHDRNISVSTTTTIEPHESRSRSGTTTSSIPTPRAFPLVGKAFSRTRTDSLKSSTSAPIPVRTLGSPLPTPPQTARSANAAVGNWPMTGGQGDSLASVAATANLLTTLLESLGPKSPSGTKVTESKIPTSTSSPPSSSESQISTQRLLASDYQLSAIDVTLLKGLLQSMQNATSELRKEDSSDAEKRTWRRRLDAARRVLDGGDDL